MQFISWTLEINLFYLLILSTGRKKRLQYLVLFFSLFSVVCGLVLLGVGCGSGSTGFLAGLFLFLLLVTVGGILFVFYLRAIGRLNLPCWPSRAARISRTLLPSSATGDPAYVAVSSSSGGGAKRSSTELTLAESQIGTASMQQQLEQQQQAERSKLIEESDTAEAEKIDGSGPRIVLNMES